MIAYAPILDTQIPAFRIIQKEENGKNLLYPEAIKINFAHNIAVSYVDVDGLRLILKSVTPSANETKNLILYTSEVSITSPEELQKGEVIFTKFNINQANIQIIPGNYYKLQIAYKSKNATNYVYSTVGIARCLASNTRLYIEGLSDASTDASGRPKLNEDVQTYTGKYETDTSTEIVYKYKFDLTTLEGECLESSGWQFPAGGTMEFTHSQWLDFERQYIITLTVTTVNGYEETVSYVIVRTGSYPALATDLYLTATQDMVAKENGYVLISLQRDPKVRVEPITAEGVLLRRRISATKVQWEELESFNIYRNSDLSNYQWKDFSIAHGEGYIYAIRFCAELRGRKYWTDMISSVDPLPSQPKLPEYQRKPVITQFEHVYLGDAEKQLCIKFDPSITNFKENILEQKVNTLGSRYPYFFRNGDVKYKEISISGLISYWMDTNNLFSNNAVFKTDLTNENFTAERNFKIEVFDWLNNGRPKVFRSAAEGNYVVRLTNITLTPKEQLGRMLHAFSSVGYEVMDYDIKAMKQPGNNVIAFPRYISKPESSEQEFNYQWVQTIKDNSVTVPMQTENSEAEYEYVLVAKQENTYAYSFNLAQGVSSADIQLFIPTKEGLFTETSFISFNDLNPDEEHQFSVKFLQSNNKFAVRKDLITDIIHYQRVQSRGYDSVQNFITTARRYAFSIGENQTCSTQKTDLLYDQSIYRLYNLIVTPMAGINKENAWVDIEYQDMTKERIDLSDGNQRIYFNLDFIRRIEKGNGVHLSIYALLKPNVSSALDAFILDASVLGGSL